MGESLPEVSRLCDAFQRVSRERMQGFPLFNPVLSVEPVGFQTWNDRPLGILIAPWFMNLVLMPGPHDDWGGLETGQRKRWALPCGEYEFTVSRVEAAGVYQSCALFTTVLGFPDQETARRVAREIMSAIQCEPAAPRNGPRLPVSRRDFLGRPFRGE